MSATVLQQLIRDRIATDYGGNQAAFARAIGQGSSIVNRWVTGNIKLPRPEARRRLAAALGIRHVDLLVAAGELWPEEVSGVAVMAPPVPSEVEGLFAQLPPETREAQVGAIRAFIKLINQRDVALAPVEVPDPR